MPSLFYASFETARPTSDRFVAILASFLLEESGLMRMTSGHARCLFHVHVRSYPCQKISLFVNC